MRRESLRQQSALELLTTYSWAFLIIAIFIAAIAVISGSRPPTSYLSSTCNIDPAFPCDQAAISSYNSVAPITFYVFFTNNLGTPIYLPSNSLNATLTNVGQSGTHSYLGNCYPALALKGAIVKCYVQIPGTVEPSTGSQVGVNFYVEYSICTSSAMSSCSGSYKTTGYALQSLSPPATGIYYVKFITSPQSGSIVVDNIQYANGTTALLVSGKYTAFASPPGGYAFSSWAVNSISSTLSSTSLQNTTLTVASNATLTANFAKMVKTTSTIPLVYFTSVSSTTVSSTSVSSTSVSSTSLSTTTTTTIQYIYCVGDAYASQYTQVYYAPVSSTGIGAWTSTTSYPVAMDGAGCSIYNGYIYCVGTYGASPYTQVYYAPVSSTGIGTWTSTTSYPVAMEYVGCSIYNGYIYCVGSDTSPYTQVYYAPVSSTGIGTWTATTSYPVVMGDDGCSIYNGYIYCVGTYGASPNTQVYYAPVSSTGIGAWTSTTSYPVAMYAAGCSIYNGYIYCVGTYGPSPYTQVYYAPVSSTGIGAWTSTTSYPVPMYYAGCSIYNGYIYCVGTEGASPYTQVYYAPVSSTGIGAWTSTTSYPVGMYAAYCEIPGSGGGYLGGGGPN
jgi:hypothetical protein